MQIVAGDYVGRMIIDFGVLWTGPRADKFYGVRFANGVSYAPSDLGRVKEIRSGQFNTKGVVAGAATGAVLLGPLGVLLGAASAALSPSNRLVGIEFKDGKRVVVQLDGRDKAFECLELYARANQLVDIDF